MNQTTCSDDYVVADRHVASHPAVSSDLDLPDFEFRWEGEEAISPVATAVSFGALIILFTDLSTRGYQG